MKWIVSNHKMNLTKEQIETYVNQISSLKSMNKLVFCPSNIYFSYFQNQENFQLGSQNVADRNMGALTGEVAVEQLKSLNVKYVIIGHSERRNILNETEEMIHQKLKLTLENGMLPILCIGEKEEEISEREIILKEEIDSAFSEQSNLDQVIIAYEPIWAIGTGRIPTPEEITSITKWIKDYVKEKYQVVCPVLYCGSVSENNIEELNTVLNIDGYLIGGTSLDVEKLKVIIEKTEEEV